MHCSAGPGGSERNAAERAEGNQREITTNRKSTGAGEKLQKFCQPGDTVHCSFRCCIFSNCQQALKWGKSTSGVLNPPPQTTPFGERDRTTDVLMAQEVGCSSSVFRYLGQVLVRSAQVLRSVEKLRFCFPPGGSGGKAGQDEARFRNVEGGSGRHSKGNEQISFSFSTNQKCRANTNGFGFALLSLVEFRMSWL